MVNIGAVSILLQEIISVYPLLSPPALTAVASNRVCNALALFQCIASHNATRTHLLNGEQPVVVIDHNYTLQYSCHCDF